MEIFIASLWFSLLSSILLILTKKKIHLYVLAVSASINLVSGLLLLYFLKKGGELIWITSLNLGI